MLDERILTNKGKLMSDRNMADSVTRQCSKKLYRLP